MEKQFTMQRKSFIETIALGATAWGISSLAPIGANAKEAMPPAIAEKPADADEWFNQLKGKKHSVVYDVSEPNGIFPFAWSRIFMVTNESTGAKPGDCGVVVVLRHNAIPFAMESGLWEQYKFGEFFKADDPKTKKPSLRNAFSRPAPGDFKIPGVGEVKIGIDELQHDGVMFCVCGMAMQVMSAVMAEQLNVDATDLKKKWLAGLLPGIQVVPSGVWALGRAQEHGCGYVKA